MYMLGVLPEYKYLFTDESKSYVANSALEYGFKHGTRSASKSIPKILPQNFETRVSEKK